MILYFFFFLSHSFSLLVPPHIEENDTSSDTEVREGSDVSLRCVANGSPEPEITWRREDNQEITIDKKKGIKSLYRVALWGSR